MHERSRPTHMLTKRDSPQNKRPMQSESEGLKTFQANGQEKTARVVILISDKIDFKKKKKAHKKRHTRPLHNTQGKNPAKRHKHCKYICTQHRSTQIHKENLQRCQETY